VSYKSDKDVINLRGNEKEISQFKIKCTQGNLKIKDIVVHYPIVSILSDTIWTGEFNFNYMITPNKLKVNLGYFPNFTNDINTFRLGATLFL